MLEDVEHIVDVARGEGLRDGVRLDGCPLKRSRRRVAMMAMLATEVELGEFAGPDGFPCLPLCGDRYIMGCGHSMKRREAQSFVDQGLLMAGPAGLSGRATLVITDAGRSWLRR